MRLPFAAPAVALAMVAALAAPARSQPDEGTDLAIGPPVPAGPPEAREETEPNTGEPWRADSTAIGGLSWLSAEAGQRHLGHVDLATDPVDFWELTVRNPARVRLEMHVVARFLDEGRTRWEGAADAGHDLDLSLHDAEGRRAARRLAGTDNTSVEVIEASLGPGTYYVRVAAWRPSDATYPVAAHYVLSLALGALSGRGGNRLASVDDVYITSPEGKWVVAARSSLRAHLYRPSDDGAYAGATSMQARFRWFEDYRGEDDIPIRERTYELPRERVLETVEALDSPVTDTLAADLVRPGRAYTVEVRLHDGDEWGPPALASTRAALDDAGWQAARQAVMRVSRVDGAPEDWRLSYAQRFSTLGLEFIRTSSADCADFLIELWYRYTRQHGYRFPFPEEVVQRIRRAIRKDQKEANKALLVYARGDREIYYHWDAGPSQLGSDGWGYLDRAERRTYLFSRRVGDRDGDGRLGALDALSGDFWTSLGRDRNGDGILDSFGHTHVVIDVLASDHFLDGQSGEIDLARLGYLDRLLGKPPTEYGVSPLREPILHVQTRPPHGGVVESLPVRPGARGRTIERP
ncbi:MAG: pre-peptidase C-terminal domain-containing protein [Planctomycetes bacterium]|nr:pre-peptidase C-terminal domain-containing protein [Planctomycetota bacterium]